MYDQGGSSSAAEKSARPPTATSSADPGGDTTDLPSPPGESCPAVSLIDYEYSGHNPRGFDVGNHFCEWMADYSTAEPHVLDLDGYPSPEERRLFSRAYLGAMHGVSTQPDVGSQEEELSFARSDEVVYEKFNEFRRLFQKILERCFIRNECLTTFVL